MMILFRALKKCLALVYLCVSRGGGACDKAHEWKAEGNFQESLLSFYKWVLENKCKGLDLAATTFTLRDLSLALI